MTLTTSTMTATTEILLEAFDAVLADLDGVVYAGPNAIPGAVDALTELAAHQVKLAYVTNNASRTPGEVAAHLRELGAPAADDQVVSSAQAGAELLAQKFHYLAYKSISFEREAYAMENDLNYLQHRKLWSFWKYTLA